MRVEFHYYVGGQKRWFAKVVKKAAERVSAITSRFAYQMPDAWSAEFAVDEMNRTRVQRVCDRHQTSISVTFAAAGWQSLDSSTDDAMSQLASAVLCTVSQDLAKQFRRAFIAGGITRLRRVLVSSAVAIPDPNYHVELCFNKPIFDIDGFHCLYDQLDDRLRERSLGLVDGSSWGLASCCLDISLPQLEPGIRSILDFVIEQGHHDCVTLLDVQTGERLGS